jgi:hypothetical protein
MVEGVNLLGKDNARHSDKHQAERLTLSGTARHRGYRRQSQRPFPVAVVKRKRSIYMLRKVVGGQTA